MLRAILTFVLVFALLAVISGLVGWAGPLEVLLLCGSGGRGDRCGNALRPGRRDAG